MGQPKLLLPWGHQTVIEAVVTALRNGGVPKVLVVVGPKMEAIAERASAAGALILSLSEPTADMRKTVEQGLYHLRKQHLLQEQDGWLLSPADHPTLSPQIVHHLIAEFVNDANSEAGQSLHSTPKELVSQTGSVLVPVYQGRRGHPLLLSARCIPTLLSLPVDCGINALLRHPAIHVREVPCDDPTILDDLDTPLDYARLRRRSSNG
jgi:molybdenum cofactor cytidylyltransferase